MPPQTVDHVTAPATRKYLNVAPAMARVKQTYTNLTMEKNVTPAKELAE